MRLLLDTANLDDIRYFHKYYPIVGVTTNPTILAREGGDPIAHLKAIREIIGEDKELHLQVTETEYDRILTEAMALVKMLGKNTFIKIPATDVGLKATHYLSDMGYRITVTAVLSATQAMLAANSGASYVAPYISRLENICDDGVGCAADIVKIFAAGNSNTQVLAASFKTAKEVLDVAVIGCHAATVSSDILRKMLAHTTTNSSIADFEADWKRAFGERTLLSMLEH
ncbi:MAG: fructose-6-phosphate aldolase [Clostridia bacterium]|nr:fructose-6-phosphate aldolase [Clostridia bacterium]